MRILTIEELKKRGKNYEIFENGDYCYFHDTNRVLVRNGKIIVNTDGGIESYSDGWYLYYSEKNDKEIYYLMDENGNEILMAEWINRDIKKKGAKEEFYIKDVYSYFSKEEVIKHYEERKKITSIKVLTKKEIESLGYEYIEFENGDYKYRDDKDVEYLIRNGQTIAVGREIESHPNGWYQYRHRRPRDDYDVDRLLNKNHHIIAESKKIVVREGDYEIFDEEDFEKWAN